MQCFIERASDADSLLLSIEISDRGSASLARSIKYFFLFVRHIYTSEISINSNRESVSLARSLNQLILHAHTIIPLLGNFYLV